MGSQNINDVRAAQANELQRVRQIADQQAQKTGYNRTEAFTPQPKARNPYTPGGERTAGDGSTGPASDAPLPKSPPVQGGAQDDPNLKVTVGPDGVVHRNRTQGEQ